MKRRALTALGLFGLSALGALLWFPGAGCDGPSREGPLVLAHRGLTDFAPENSIASIQEALKAGADGSEIDVHLAGSGEVVVLHDPSVDRVSDGHGFVKDLTLERIKSFRLDPGPGGRYRDERIPTLEEMLSAFTGEAVIFIEMKRPGGMQESPDGLEEKVGAVIDRLGLYGTTFVSSFNPISLAKIKKAYPRVRTVLEYHEGAEKGLPRPGWLEAAGEVYAIGPSIGTASRETVEWARSKGYRVSTYPPQSLDDLEKAAALGFDIVTTPRPELFRMVLEGAFTKKGLASFPVLTHLAFEGEQSRKLPITRREAFAGQGAMDLAIDGERGALVDLTVKPETLYLFTFHVKAEGGAEGDEPNSRIFLIERAEPAQEPGQFKFFDASDAPGEPGHFVRQGPSLFGEEAARDKQGWMRIRFAFRTLNATRSLRLILGAARFHGHLLVDELTLRELVN